MNPDNRNFNNRNVILSRDGGMTFTFTEAIPDEAITAEPTIGFEEFVLHNPLTARATPTVEDEVITYDETGEPIIDNIKVEEPFKLRNFFGYLKEVPKVVLKEEFLIKDSNENSETVRFYIKEQDIKNFEFNLYINKNTLKVEDKSFPSYTHIVKIFSSNKTDSSEEGNSIYIWLKGERDFKDENKFFDISYENYNYVKKAFEFMRFEIIEDTEGKKKIEELNKEIENKIDYTFNETPTDEEVEKMIELVDLDTFNNIIRARMIQDGNTSKIKSITKNWTKEYLKKWAISKYRFYKMFGDKLTIEKDIEITKDENESVIILNELKAKFPLYRRILESVSPRAVVNDSIGNKRGWLIETYLTECPEVKEDMSFTKFISLFKNKELDIELSKKYQDKGKAHITISINPIDYLTVSINNSGWRSCHNFFDGEWRNAGLSYMNDSASLVAYRSKGLYEYKKNDKKFKWNSKNWREMIYVSRNNSAIVFSREYPTYSEELARAVRTMLENVISNYFKGNNNWKLYRSDSNANIEVRTDGSDLIYNDVREGFDHRAVRAKDDREFDSFIEMTIGAPVRSISDDGFLEDESECIW